MASLWSLSLFLLSLLLCATVALSSTEDSVESTPPAEAAKETADVAVDEAAEVTGDAVAAVDPSSIEVDASSDTEKAEEVPKKAKTPFGMPSRFGAQRERPQMVFPAEYIAALQREGMPLPNFNRKQKESGNSMSEEKRKKIEEKKEKKKLAQEKKKLEKKAKMERKEEL
jgi:hypothetical protein